MASLALIFSFVVFISILSCAVSLGRIERMMREWMRREEQFRRLREMEAKR